jgi:hypothetical protein
MLALSNMTNVVRCHMPDWLRRALWHLTLSAEVVISEQWRQGERGGMREGEDGNNRGGQQQQCLSSSNQVAIRKHKKAQKNHNNQPPKPRQRACLVAGKGAKVSRLTDMGSVRDETTGGGGTSTQERGGVMRVIADVDRGHHQ